MKRAFVSFDCDHDLDLKTMIEGQSKTPGTPFRVDGFSTNEPFVNNWKARAKKRIAGCDLVIVICGEHTHESQLVSAELQIAQEERLPYFFLRGRSRKPCAKPQKALDHDRIYDWTWDSLKVLVDGVR
jgi:hypothetical protein